MVTITYIEHDGTPHVHDVTAGLTVKDGAMNNDVPGILAQCGGACACATCHVYVDPAWESRLEPPEEGEVGMLECATLPGPGSRLSCQIIVSEALNGLVVRIPLSQD
jgi:2Fe-2S ferredoxin